MGLAYCTSLHCSWFFDNFPMFAYSFRVVSVHCVVRGSGASFVYKCPASRGSSLRQHGLIVPLPLAGKQPGVELEKTADKTKTE